MFRLRLGVHYSVPRDFPLSLQANYRSVVKPPIFSLKQANWTTALFRKLKGHNLYTHRLQSCLSVYILNHLPVIWNWTGSGYVRVPGSCERGNERSGSINRWEFLTSSWTAIIVSRSTPLRSQLPVIDKGIMYEYFLTPHYKIYFGYTPSKTDGFYLTSSQYQFYEYHYILRNVIIYLVRR
jgi:hypothetical protein